MPISTGAALLIGGGLGAAGGVASSLIGANAAGNAASTQAQAADEAAQLQFELGQENLGFQEQQYVNSLGLLQPYYESGTSAMGTLDQLLGLPGVQGNTSVFLSPFGANGAPGLPSTPGIGGSTGPFNGSTIPLNGPAVPLNTLLPGAGTSPIALQQMAATGVPGEPGAPALSAAQQDAAAQIEGFASPNPRFNPNAPGSVGPVPFIPPPGSTPPQTGPGGPNGPLIANGNPAQSTVPLSSLAGNVGTAGNAVGNTGLPAGFLSQTFNTPFAAPTAEEAEQMPGFQFQLQQGEQALQNSAAAQGNILSGTTLKGLDQYSQGLASTDYNNLFNQALTQYQQAYNVFNQNQANVFNRYAALAGIGQTTAGQLSSSGLTTGANVGNVLSGTGAQIGQQLNNAAAARASGYVGAANAIGGGLGSLGSLGSLLPLYSLLGQNSSGASSPTSFLTGTGA